MKYKVKVGERIFEVEINNLHSQPIIALVDGEAVEVWVEEPQIIRLSPKPSGGQGPQAVVTSLQTKALSSQEGKVSKPDEGFQKTVRFPIPGVIVSLSLKEGDEVAVGQELCVLEAMKMKNVIRAPRSGIVSSLRVMVGQTVKHHDILLEFIE